ncbi:hypothetical protein LF1_53020 [Rubripirellula obstinata]|uniref:Uncharacterized protein n=1 Tax=Rubripirellula obstinata TaxID=406547 RepID=A0A5B1CDF3_9BACT|nr:hypothetical protein LF1_53020 [Rubripirellula obstinata]
MTCTGVGLAGVFQWNINCPNPVMSDVIRAGALSFVLGSDSRHFA